MKRTKFTVLVYEEREDDGGGYWATVAELPGCFTSGETIDEIKENIRDAIEAYIESIVLTDDELPRSVFAKFEVGVDVARTVAAMKADLTR